jgi:hypothetical protein
MSVISTAEVYSDNVLVAARHTKVTNRNLVNMVRLVELLNAL